MKSKPKSTAPRKSPRQARSKQTLRWILEGAARVFHAEGFDATTNRIATAAGVSIGTLYEYFPNKEALLAALAEEHVALAERGINKTLDEAGSNPTFLASLQQAIMASHRYPSQAIERLSDPAASDELRSRVLALRARVLAALLERARASGRPEFEARAHVVFGAIAELSSRAVYSGEQAHIQAAIARQLLTLASTHLG